MKIKILNKKLNLNKITVAGLDARQMHLLFGGVHNPGHDALAPLLRPDSGTTICDVCGCWISDAC